MQVGTVAAAHGWRWGMWAPGIIGLALAALVFAAVSDSPQDAGFAPVDPEPAAAAKQVGREQAFRRCGVPRE